MPDQHSEQRGVGTDAEQARDIDFHGPMITAFPKLRQYRHSQIRPPKGPSGARPGT